MYVNNNYSYLNNLFLINLNKKYNSEIKERLMLFVDLKLKEINSTGLQFLEDSLEIINIKNKEINDDFLIKNKNEIISFFNPMWFKEAKSEKLNKQNVFNFLHFNKRRGNIKMFNIIIDNFFKSVTSLGNQNPTELRFYFDNMKFYGNNIGEKIIHKRISLNKVDKEYLIKLYHFALTFYIELKSKYKSFFIKKEIMSKFPPEKINLFLSFLNDNNFKYELIDDKKFPGLYFDIKIEDNYFYLHENFPFKDIRFLVEFKTSLKEAEEEFNFLIS